MSQQKVENAIRRLQKHVQAYQQAPPNGFVNHSAAANNHVASTRYMLVDPILRAMGWDLGDPRNCIVEFRPNPNEANTRADYALLNRSRQPAALVETRRIGQREPTAGWETRMKQLANDTPTAHVVALTNGQYWSIWLREDDEWIPESDRPLGLHWHDVPDTARRLRTHLARDHYR